MTDWANGMMEVLEAMNYQRRTVVPGLVATTISEPSEQVADFTTGISDLVAGQPSLPDITADAPMMNIASGGFYLLMPVMPGQEALGLVGDRASGLWRETKVPGQADPVNGKRSKVLHDMVLTPFAYTAPIGAPTDWAGKMVLGGATGVAIEVDLLGTVTITGQAVDPLIPTVITMEPGGNITLEVGTGNSVHVGGPASAALALAQKVVDAIDAAIIAAVAAAAAIVPPNGDGGSAGFAAFQGAWDVLKSLIAALKAKGE